MDVSICHPKELDNADVERWRAWQQAGKDWSSPFVSASFVRMVGQSRDDARVAIVNEGPRTVAYFPFHLRKLGIGEAIGFGVSDSQAIIHELGYEYSPAELVRKCGLGAWEFDHVTPNAAEKPHVEAWETGALMDVSRGFEAYLDESNLSRSKRYKSSLTHQRKMSAEFGPLHLDFDASDEDAFLLLLAWKSQQYKRTGRGDRFAIPWIRSLVESLLHSREPDCTGLLSVLRAGDQVVAVHFGLRNTTDLALWFPAYNRDLSRYSPGTIFNLRLAEAACDYGLKKLDLGKGDESYKALLSTDVYQVGEGAVMLKTPASALSWARRVPKRTAIKFVVSHPKLRHAARSTLNTVGRLRS